jgi:hypothetical protein
MLMLLLRPVLSDFHPGKIIHGRREQAWFSMEKSVANWQHRCKQRGRNSLQGKLSPIRF